MRRAYLLSTCKFPRGSASANYLQYLGMAFSEMGYEVILVSYGNKALCEYSNGKYKYKDIEFRPIEYSNEIEKKVIDKYFLGEKIIGLIKKKELSSEDIIVAYTSNINILKKILTFGKKKKIFCAACIVEWFPRELYTGKSYKDYVDVFEKIYPRFDLLLPISTYIADFFNAKNVPTFVLPILADPYEYNYSVKETGEKRKFIFVQNGRMKDAIDDVFSSINLLEDSVFSRMEFHFKGVKPDEIDRMLTLEKKRYIGTSIFIHGWMAYDELIALYRAMHYLLLPREDNQMTRANFPSKVPEVMGLGVVPIVTPIGDYTDIYLKNDYNSIYIESAGAEGCQRAIIRAVNYTDDDFLRLSSNARNTVENELYYKVWEERLSNAFSSGGLK